MKGVLLASFLVWRGLFLGAENTAPWFRPLDPGLTFSATAVASRGPVTFRAVVIQPTKGGPAFQFGASVRVF